jgi:hypothetical protein
MVATFKNLAKTIQLQKDFLYQTRSTKKKCPPSVQTFV